MRKQPIEPIYVLVGKRIHQERLLRKMSLAFLASRCRLASGASHLLAIEQGKMRCQLHILEAVAEELGIPLAHFLVDADVPSI